MSLSRLVPPPRSAPPPLEAGVTEVLPDTARDAVGHGAASGQPRARVPVAQGVGLPVHMPDPGKPIGATATVGGLSRPPVTSADTTGDMDVQARRRAPGRWAIRVAHDGPAAAPVDARNRHRPLIKQVP